MRIADQLMRESSDKLSFITGVGPTYVATSIDATNIADWYAALADKSNVDFTRCVPPFEETLVEFTRGWQCHAVFVRREQIDEAKWKLTSRVLFQSRDGRHHVLPLSIENAVTGAGEVIEGWMPIEFSPFATAPRPSSIPPASRHIGVIGWHKRKGDLANAHDVETIASFANAVALLTFRFMHARNVVLRDRPPSRHERRRAEKAGGPAPVIYKVLDIRPITRRLEAEGRVAEVGLARALHLCRGHFADYTQGAGLFGKYKTEVFVPEHVRGSLSRGEVVKTYRPHPITP